jgi:hypothetical protein
MCYRRKQALKMKGGADASLEQHYGGGSSKIDINNIADDNGNAMNVNKQQQQRRGVPAFGPILPTTYMNGNYGASNMVCLSFSFVLFIVCVLQASPATTYVVPTRKVSPLSRLPAGAIMEPIEEVMSPPPLSATTTPKNVNGGNTSVVSVAAEYEQFRYDLQKNIVKVCVFCILIVLFYLLLHSPATQSYS